MTGERAGAFLDSLSDGFLDEVWIILEEHPSVPGGAAFDRTKFVDVLESGIHVDPSYVSNVFTGANVGVLGSRPPFGGSVRPPRPSRTGSRPCREARVS